MLVPGVGASANGASRWIAVGSFQIQPSELAKLALVLYGANLLAERPTGWSASIRTLVPYLAVVAFACLLMVVEPDLGTAIVVCLTAAAHAGRGGYEDAAPGDARVRDRGGRAARDHHRAVPDGSA